MEAIYDWIKNIVYFLLFTTLLRNLLGKEYQKYASLLLGLCLVLQIAEPLVRIGEETSFSFLLGVNKLEEYEQENSWLEADKMSENLEQLVLEEAKDLLTEQTAALVEPAGYVLEHLELHREKGKGVEQEDDVDKGTITGFTVWLTLRGNAEEDMEKGEIETISITDIVIRVDRAAQERDQGQPLVSDEQPDDSPEELAMKKKLADFYDMEESHINVIIPMGNNT